MAQNKTPSSEAKRSRNGATPPPSALAKAILAPDTGHDDVPMHNDTRSEALESIAENEEADSIDDPDDASTATTHVPDEEEKHIQPNPIIIVTPSSQNKENPMEDTKSS